MNESPIFSKTYDFIIWLLQTTEKFPKSQRFVMAKRVEEAILNFHDRILRAAIIKGEVEKNLDEADYELEKFRFYLRICKDLKLISLKQYEYTSKNTVEIGKLLGGWKKRQSDR
jgi:hypothetical protein